MSVVRRMDKVVNEFVAALPLVHEPMTKARAKMFALHCPDWDMRLRIIGACSEKVIADHVWEHYLNGIAAAGDAKHA